MSFRSDLVVLVILAAVAQVACLELQTTNSSGAGGAGTGASGSSSSGVSFCDAATNSCDACVMCALQFPGGPCPAQLYTCSLSTACSNIYDCAAACMDDRMCIEACMAMYPQGVMAYVNLNACVYCTQCATECAALNLCLD